MVGSMVGELKNNYVFGSAFGARIRFGDPKGLIWLVQNFN